MKQFLDVSYSDYEETKVDIYLPEGEGYTTIVNFHGGGLDHGSKRGTTLDKLSVAFTGAGYGFASVEYRMYPNAKYPDFIEDCAKATAFVKEFVKERGGSGDIIIMGQSAGAWLSLMLCLNGKFLKAEGIDPLDIKAWFIDSAQVTSHFKVIEEEHGENPKAQRIDEFAPLYYIGENTRFTKMLLILYDNDMACRYEQNMLFYKAVLNFNPEADIQYRLFSGKHCSLGKQEPVDGQLPYLKTFLEWIK
ncbi:MAG: alpha/beta hydrolase [Clostridia bacterium]|nr:alpha/beta hydrolase [Clostridia bacterium]